jgi:hypothetical protein
MQGSVVTIILANDWKTRGTDDKLGKRNVTNITLPEPAENSQKLRGFAPLRYRITCGVFKEARYNSSSF